MTAEKPSNEVELKERTLQSKLRYWANLAALPDCIYVTPADVLNEAADAIAQVSALESSIRLANHAFDESQAALGKLEARVRELEAELSEAGNTIIDLRATNAQLLAERDQFRADYIRVVDRLEEMQEKAAELEAERDRQLSYHAESERLRNELHRLKAVAADGTAKLEAVKAVTRYSMRGNENCVDYDYSEAADGDWVKYYDLCEALASAAPAATEKP